VEYRVTDWLWKNMPDARVSPSGTVRFWFDAWHDLAELGGGSEQGLLNPLVQPAQCPDQRGNRSAVRHSVDAGDGRGRHVHCRREIEEPYKDVQNQGRFAGAATPCCTTMARATRSTASRAATGRACAWWIRRSSMRSKTPRDSQDIERLRPYVDVVENGPDSPATLERPGTDAILVHARLDAWPVRPGAGDVGPGVAGVERRHAAGLRKDAMGFMVVDAPPGDAEIRLVFAMPFENRVGWALTGLSLAVLAGLFFGGSEAGEAPGHAVAGGAGHLPAQRVAQRPLFMRGELPFRGSIEDGYVAIARFVSAHPNPWGWDPFQYCGIPTRFLYVPALPYLTAFLAHLLPHVPLAFIYRVIVSACHLPRPGHRVLLRAAYFTAAAAGRWPPRWCTAVSRLRTDCSPRWKRTAASCSFPGGSRCWPSMAKARTTPRWR
jgi:hypothetical protein